MKGESGKVMTSETSHGKFSDILALADESLRPVCVRLREQILAAHAGAFEIVWPKLWIASFGVGPKKMTEHYAYIGVQKSHINLGFYHGAILPDPNGLLEGTGKKLRHVKIHSLEATRTRALKKLLRQAVADRLKAKTK
jgi:hypothetical protein